MTQIASFVVDLYNKCNVLRQKTSLNHVNLVESCKGQSDKQFKFGFIARRLYNRKKNRTSGLPALDKKKSNSYRNR